LIDITNPEFELVVGDLFKLARGDFDLVQEAIIQTMKIANQKKYPSWQFWHWFDEATGNWEIDVIEASNYIKSRRNELESIKEADDLNK
jgi:hypothetical protein